MLRFSARAALLATLLGLTACDRTVTTTGGPGGAGTTGQSAVTNGVTTGPTAAANTGATTTNAATGAAATSSTSTGGCVGSMSVAIDNGAPVDFGSSCAGTWGASYSVTAAGWIASGGPPPGFEALEISGCVASGMGSSGLQLSLPNVMSPGSYTTGTTQYTDGMGVTWGIPGDPIKVTVTTLDPTGGSIDGMFSVVATHGGNAAHSLGGTFHVCHVSDELAP